MKENSKIFKLKLRKQHLRNYDSLYCWCNRYDLMAKAVTRRDISDVLC